MKTGLALRMRAVSGTTSLTAENKQGTTVHDDVKDKHRALLHSDAMKVDVAGGWPAFRIQKQISAAQIAEEPLKKSALDRRNLVKPSGEKGPCMRFRCASLALARCSGVRFCPRSLAARFSMVSGEFFLPR